MTNPREINPYLNVATSKPKKLTPEESHICAQDRILEPHAQVYLANSTKVMVAIRGNDDPNAESDPQLARRSGVFKGMDVKLKSSRVSILHSLAPAVDPDYLRKKQNTQGQLVATEIKPDNKPTIEAQIFLDKILKGIETRKFEIVPQQGKILNEKNELIFKNAPEKINCSLIQKKSIDGLNNIKTKAYTLVGNDFYFVNGLTGEKNKLAITRAQIAIIKKTSLKSRLGFNNKLNESQLNTILSITGPNPAIKTDRPNDYYKICLNKALPQEPKTTIKPEELESNYKPPKKPHWWNNKLPDFSSMITADFKLLYKKEQEENFKPCLIGAGLLEGKAVQLLPDHDGFLSGYHVDWLNDVKKAYADYLQHYNKYDKNNPQEVTTIYNAIAKNPEEVCKLKEAVHDLDKALYRDAIKKSENREVDFLNNEEDKKFVAESLARTSDNKLVAGITDPLSALLARQRNDAHHQALPTLGDPERHGKEYMTPLPPEPIGRIVFFLNGEIKSRTGAEAVSKFLLEEAIPAGFAIDIGPKWDMKHFGPVIDKILASDNPLFKLHLPKETITAYEASDYCKNKTRPSTAENFSPVNNKPPEAPPKRCTKNAYDLARAAGASQQIENEKKTEEEKIKAPTDPNKLSVKP